MQIGIDSFAAVVSDLETGKMMSPGERLGNLLEEIDLADQVGLDSFGIGEHHREEYLDSASRAQFDATRGPTGAYMIGDAETVAQKILAMNQSLGGLDRVTFQMTNVLLPHAKMKQGIELLGSKVAAIVRNELQSSS